LQKESMWALIVIVRVAVRSAADGNSEGSVLKFRPLSKSVLSVGCVMMFAERQ
jgi:hypothetical protein